jgi:hypothetical protein
VITALALTPEVLRCCHAYDCDVRTIAAAAVMLGGLLLMTGGAILAGVGTILVVARLLGVGEGSNEPWGFLVEGVGLLIVGFALVLFGPRLRSSKSPS